VGSQQVGEKMNDWNHQIVAVAESIRRIEAGERRFCITSPTGGGKSRIILRLCEWAVARGWNVAVFTNRRLLTAQLSRGLSDDGIHLGVRAADFESWSDPFAPVQICSVPTEDARVLKKRIAAMLRCRTEEEAERDHQLFPAQLVIVDEVHMNCGTRTVAILDEYREKHDAVVIGVTATPLGVSHVCDSLIVAGNMTELRACGALVAARCYEPAVIDLPKIKRTKSYVFFQSQRQADEAIKTIWTQHIVGHIWTQWKALNPDARPSLGMAPGVKESLGLAMEFWRNGVNAAHIDAEGVYVDGDYRKTNDPEVRNEIFQRSKSGEVPIIFNRFVLREAIDLPWLQHLVLCTPIASVLSYVQTVGRVLRAFPGKEFALITDHANSIRAHGSPNMDRDREWRQYFFEDEAKMTRDRQEALRDPVSKEPEPITCPQCAMIRRSGAVCPGCGYTGAASIRYIIQRSGDLVPTPGDVFPRRKTKMTSDTLSQWIKIYHQMRNAKKPKSFRQALAYFKHLHHYEPPHDLPLMPKERRDFTRKIRDVPFRDLIPREDQYQTQGEFKTDKTLALT